MIVWDNFNQNVAKIMKIQGLNMLLLSCIGALVYPLYRHWYCAIVGPANSDLADNRIMSFPLCNLNIVAVMVKILLNMKKFSQKKRHFSGAKRGWESMSQFCTNSLHSQEKWTVALVEEHYSLCNYNLCSGR